MNVETPNVEHRVLKYFCGSSIVIVLDVLVKEWSSLPYLNLRSSNLS